MRETGSDTVGRSLWRRWLSAAWLLSLAAVVAPPGLAGDEWLQWGGPGRDFKVEASGLASSWPESGPEVVWEREIGEGFSGVLYQRGRLYTSARDGDQETVLAIDARSGVTLWMHAYPAPHYEEQTTQFGKGPNATPLIVRNRICSVGFTSKLRCLDRNNGNLVWKHDLVEEFGGIKVPFGYAASPVAYEDMVVVLVGGDKHGAMGFDLEDGTVRWTTPPLDISYASPALINVGGQDQLAFMTSAEVVGVDLDRGEIQWRHPHKNQYENNCAGPWWTDDGLLFVASQGTAGGRTLKLTRVEGKTHVEELSSNVKMKVFHNTAIRLGDFVYAGSHEMIVAHNVRTGEFAWREEGFTEANLILADGKVVLLDEEGKLALATVSPQGFEVLASHTVLEKPAWTVPTLVGPRLYVRGNGKLVALDLGEAADSSPEPPTAASPPATR